MVKKATVQFFGPLLNFLGSKNGVRAAMLAAGSALLLGATFLMLSAYFAGEERDRARAVAEAAKGAVVTETGEDLAVTAEHLTELKSRLGQHLDGAAPFRLIEEHLDPEVGFANVAVDYETPSVEFSLHAPNAGSIARQAASFEDDERITSVLVSPLERDRETNRYEGTMTITLNPEILLAFPNFNQSS